MQEVGGSIPPGSTSFRLRDRFFFGPASPSSRGLGHIPFTDATGVRIPVGTPLYPVYRAVSGSPPSVVHKVLRCQISGSRLPWKRAKMTTRCVSAGIMHAKRESPGDDTANILSETHCAFQGSSKGFGAQGFQTLGAADLRCSAAHASFTPASFSRIADGINRRYAFSIMASDVPVWAATVSGSTPWI